MASMLKAARTAVLLVAAGLSATTIVAQTAIKLPKNKFRPPTFPFDRSFAWQPSPLVSARSPQEAL